MPTDDTMADTPKDRQPLISRGQFLSMVGSMTAGAALSYFFMGAHETISSLEAEQPADTNVAYGGKKAS